MNFTIQLILGYFIYIPALIGIIRYKQIHYRYHPFIWFIWMGAVNESLSLYLMFTGHYNIINSNIYILLESLLILWIINQWGLFKNQVTFYILATVFLLAWIAENFIFYTMNRFASYFLIFYSFIVSLLSISLINKIIVSERKSLLKNPVFIISVAFVIYYTFSVISEAFWIYGFGTSKTLSLNFHTIAVITNFISLLIYSVAIIWMNNKLKYTLPSS